MSKLALRIIKQLKEIREAKGMSQGDVAKYLGVERSYISALENNRVNFSIKTLEKVANALGISPDQIMVNITDESGTGSKRMPISEGLLLKNIPRWQGQEWYHQRFDGAPYLIHMIGEAQIWTDRELKRKDGLSFSCHYCFFANGKADWYMLQSEINNIAKTITTRTIADPDYVEKLIANWAPDEKLFYQTCAQIEKEDLRALADTDLLNLHDRFVDLTLKRNSSSSLIDGFALGTDVQVERQVRAAYDQSALKKSVPFPEVFAALTAPCEKSFLLQAEIELYQTASQINKQPTQKETLIKNYRDKYFWLRNNYVDSLNLPLQYFEEEIARIRSTGTDPTSTLKEIEQIFAETMKKKREYRQKLKINKETSALLGITEAFAHWQDERKKATFFAAHYFTLLLDEVGYRSHLSADLLKYLSPRQINKALKGEFSAEQLKTRQAGCVYYWDKSGHDVVTGLAAVEKIKTQILGKKDRHAIQDFRGLTACLGKATGKVKVLTSAKEIHKIEAGDILVAVMTRPDYVPAMRKAAAIVTDEGGITSHAAIVSRELKIPCIIGTKIATQVLADGDLVEVNANHGVVKILK